MCEFTKVHVDFKLVYAGLAAEKLEWGNSDHLNQILHKYSGGFDLILGADIYILSMLFLTLVILSSMNKF